MSFEFQSYVCDKCDHPPFRTQNELDDHIMNMCKDTFSQFKPYKCSKCLRRFSTKDELNLHIKQMSDVIDWEHNEFQSYVCDKCDHPPFRTQNELDDHIMNMCKDTFSQFKPYKCSKCLHRFSTKDELNLHIKQMSDVIDWEHNE